MAVTEQEAVRCVRRAIDQIELSLATTGDPDLGMDADADVCAYAQSLFSNDDIKERFLSALRYVVARIGSIHVPQLVDDVDVDLPPTWPDYYRVIEESVGVNEQGSFHQAIRKTYRTQHDAAQAGRNATDQFPVYCYEDADLTIFKSSPSLSPSLASVLQVPLSITDCPDILLDAVVARTVVLLVPSYPEAEEVAARWKAAQGLLNTTLAPLNLLSKLPQREEQSDES